MDTSEITAQLMAALHQVPDPELGESIVDLGLVASVTVDDTGVRVVLIPTSATCPMSDTLVEDAEQAAAAALPPGTALDVVMDHDTHWHPSRMSAALQERFGWDGEDDLADQDG